MSRAQFAVLVLNPVEVFTESPRTARFIRALGTTQGLSLYTAGIGAGPAESKCHLNLYDIDAVRPKWTTALRLLRISVFCLAALLRIHVLTRQLHSSNRAMRSNFMVRRDIRRFIEEHQPNLVIARDIYSLPLLRGIFPRESTWIDLPDISDDVSTYRPLLRIVLGPYFRHLSRALSESAALFTTVSNSLASHFFQRNAIECSVVRNSLPYRKLTQRSSRAAVASRSDSQVPLRMVYVGAALRRREIEICLDAMDFLPDFYSLDLYLVPTDTTYLQELIDRYSHNPSIRFMPQVPLMELVDVMSLYDLALIVIPLNSQNAVGALPNKFFQAVQARLPVVTGPSPEIAHYVRKFEIGIVAADFTPQSIAGACINICETALDRFHSGLEVAALELSDNSDLNQIHHRAMLMLRRI